MVLFLLIHLHDGSTPHPSIGVQPIFKVILKRHGRTSQKCSDEEQKKKKGCLPFPSGFSIPRPLMMYGACVWFLLPARGDIGGDQNWTHPCGPPALFRLPSSLLSHPSNPIYRPFIVFFFSFHLSLIFLPSDLGSRRPIPSLVQLLIGKRREEGRKELFLPRFFHFKCQIFLPFEGKRRVLSKNRSVPQSWAFFHFMFTVELHF